MIVITTPTGNIGRQVLDNVLAGDRPVRVIVRDPDKLSDDVRDRVDVVTGSQGDPQVIDRALDGADTLFWLPPPVNADATTPEETFRGFTRPAAQAIGDRGVARVVTISALGRNTPLAGQAGLVTATLALDDLIAETGVAFRALTMPSFMDNIAWQAGLIRERGLFAGVIAPDRRLPIVATRDIAAVAARLLLDDAWSGQEEVPVIGPEDLSADDIVATMADVLSIPVRYQQISGETFREQQIGQGTPPAMAQALMEMMIAKDNGLDLGVERTPQHAVDTPTTFRTWCTEVLKPAVAA
jgi:uncharacterized protein YbjT (DUF2867 family)